MNWRVKLPDCETAPHRRGGDAPGDRIRRADVIGGLVLEEGPHIPERGHADAEDVRALGLVGQLVEQVRIEAVLEADVDRQVAGQVGFADVVGRSWKRGRRAAVREAPVGRRNHAAFGDLSVDRLLGVRRQHRGARVERDRQVGHRIAHHVQGRRVGAASVDDARQHLAGDELTVLARHRHDDPVIGATGVIDRDRGRAGVVGLPSARQADIAQVALGRVDDDVAATVRHVMPQESAGHREVDRLGDRERGLVAHFAVGVLAELDVGDDGVVVVVGIELAERPAAQRLIRDSAARDGGRRVDDDARDPRLDRCRRRDTRPHHDHRPQPPSGTVQPRLFHHVSSRVQAPVCPV